MQRHSFMRRLLRSAMRGALLAGLAASFATVWAQGPPEPARPAVAPPPVDLEPGVNTSATQTSSSPPVAVPTPAPAAPPAPARTAKPAAVIPKAAGSSAPADSAPTAARAAPRSAPTAGTARATTAPKSGAPAAKAHDRIELDITQITGNRELPKVLYIVPWKRSDLGELGKPVNSLVDEVLAPVDRDVFKRQNRYYDALKPDAAKEAAGAGAGAAAKP